LADKQREFFAKYCADVSKGALLAGLVGLGTGQIRGLYLALDILIAAAFFVAAYLQEGKRR
jgi:hypothetical protein